MITAGLNAQQPEQGGQAGQTPQTPPPGPNPQPAQPGANRPTTADQPQFPTQQNLSVRGRIITDRPLAISGATEVRFEYEGGQPVGFAYADSNGEFTFQRSGVALNDTVYVIVNVEGYKPFRERIGGAFGLSYFGGLLSIFLEREDVVKVTKPGAPVIDLKQLRAKIPSKAVDEYEKAIKESSKGNRAKAVEGLERAVKLAPDFFEAQNSLGVQYLSLQKLSEAETAFLRARDLSPKSADPLTNLGSVYYQRAQNEADAGHADEAAAIYQKAADTLDESVRRNPLSAQAHMYLGASLYKIASYERAESMLHRALELDDEQSDARLMLVNVYTKQARYDDALEQIEAFLKKNPKAPQRPALEGIKAQIEKKNAK